MEDWRGICVTTSWLSSRGMFGEMKIWMGRAALSWGVVFVSMKDLVDLQGKNLTSDLCPSGLSNATTNLT